MHETESIPFNGISENKARLALETVSRVAVEEFPLRHSDARIKTSLKLPLSKRPWF